MTSSSGDLLSPTLNLFVWLCFVQFDKFALQYISHKGRHFLTPSHGEDQYKTPSYVVAGQ